MSAPLIVVQTETAAPVGVIRLDDHAVLCIKHTLWVGQDRAPDHEPDQEPVLPSDFALCDTCEVTVAGFGTVTLEHRVEAGDVLSPADLIVGYGGDIELTISERAPHAMLTDGTYADGEPVPLACDHIWIDPDAMVAVFSYHGSFDTALLRERDRVLISEHDRAPPPLSKRVVELARAHHGFATEPGVEPSELDRARLDAERLGAHDEALEPRLPLGRYAAISAELTAGRDPRARILARHGFDEISWLVEERGWLNKIGTAVADGDASLAADYDDAFSAALDAMPPPANADKKQPTHAAVLAALEEGEDPAKVLERHSLSIGEWIMLDRYWSHPSRAGGDANGDAGSGEGDA